MTRRIDYRIAALHRREDGMFTIMNCVAIVFCVVLMGLVINVGHVAHQKVELQNTADAVAYAGAITQARAMNAITATNHVMGELLSFVVLHHAIGGYKLDRRQVADTQRIDRELELAHMAAMGYCDEGVYELVREEKTGVLAEALLLTCKSNLKQWLTVCYYWKAIAARIPPPWGPIIMGLLSLMEEQIGREYVLLNGIYRIARGLVQTKMNVLELLRQAKRYTHQVERQVPRLAEETAQTLARLNGAEGTLFGGASGGPHRAVRGAAVGNGGPITTPYLAYLPVEVDPFARIDLPNVPGHEPIENSPINCLCTTGWATNMRRQIVKTTQLARATFPWVVYHRQAVMRVLGLMPFVFAPHEAPLGTGLPGPDEIRDLLTKHGTTVADLYREFTAGACLQLCDDLQKSPHYDLGLYVIKCGSPPDRGFEQWTENEVLADQLFTVVGLAHLDPPLVMGWPYVYGQAHPNGRLTYAQAMIYNGNRQRRPPYRIDLRCKRIDPEHQADVGWNTLNWLVESDDDRVRELRGGECGATYPKIRVNWQAKLVPATGTRLRELTAAKQLPGPFSAIVDRMSDDVAPSLRTH
jgi:hypothetical protein